MREKRHLWIARHAERQDIVDPKWYESAQRPYDTPLSCEQQRLPPTSQPVPHLLRLLTLLLLLLWLLRGRTGDGHAQARATGAFVASQACPTLVVASPYLRCIQTAGEIALAAAREVERQRAEDEESDLPDVELVIDPSLAEWSNPRTYGTLTPGPLVSYAEVMQLHPELGVLRPFTSAFADSPIQHAMPRWVEDVMALHTRCQRVVRWVSDPHNALVRKHGSIALVTHGYSVAMLGSILDPTVPWHVLPSPYCCLTHMVAERAFCACCSAPDQERLLSSHRDIRTTWKTLLACSTEHLAAVPLQSRTERVPTPHLY